jgi:hypothetical protein
MEAINPVLENDVALLSRSFSSGYIPIYASFYVSLEHKDNHMHDVTNKIQDSWDDVGVGKMTCLRHLVQKQPSSVFATKCFIFGTTITNTRHDMKTEAFSNENFHISPIAIVLDGHRYNHVLIIFLCNNINM